MKRCYYAAVRCEFSSGNAERAISIGGYVPPQLFLSPSAQVHNYTKTLTVKTHNNWTTNINVCIQTCVWGK